MSSNIDEKINRFKAVMGNYPTGVTIVTTTNSEGVPVGLTVNSFTSVSLEPLLVLWCIDRRVSSYEVFKETDRFAVHTLAEDQAELCKLFASKNMDRFGNCEWQLSEYKLPILADTYGVLQCKTHQKVEAGDHLILIGEVIDIQYNEKNPLLYHRRQFGPIPAQFYEEK